MEIPEALTPDLDYLEHNLKNFRHQLGSSPRSSNWLHRLNLEVSLLNIHAIKLFNETVEKSNTAQEDLSRNANLLAWSNFILATVAALIAIFK